jgi:hypothetical protein
MQRTQPIVGFLRRVYRIQSHVANDFSADQYIKGRWRHAKTVHGVTSAFSRRCTLVQWIIRRSHVKICPYWRLLVQPTSQVSEQQIICCTVSVCILQSLHSVLSLSRPMASRCCFTGALPLRNAATKNTAHLASTNPFNEWHSCFDPEGITIRQFIKTFKT